VDEKSLIVDQTADFHSCPRDRKIPSVRPLDAARPGKYVIYYLRTAIKTDSISETLGTKTWVSGGIAPTSQR
jgi:hypothetical protein